MELSTLEVYVIVILFTVAIGMLLLSIFNFWALWNNKV